MSGAEFGGMVLMLAVIGAFLAVMFWSYKSGRKDEAEATARRNDPEGWEYQLDQKQKKEQRGLDPIPGG